MKNTLLKRSALGKDQAEWEFLRVLEDKVYENPPEYNVKAARALYQI